MLAGDQLRQIAVLLLIIAPAVDLVDAEVGVRAIRQTDRGRRAGDFLHRDAMGQIAHIGAAELLLDRDAVETQFAHGRPQVDRELVLGIDFRRARCYLLLSEGAHAVAQHVDIVAKAEVQIRVRCYRHFRTFLPMGLAEALPPGLFNYEHTFL